MLNLAPDALASVAMERGLRDEPLRALFVPCRCSAAN